MVPSEGAVAVYHKSLQLAPIPAQLPFGIFTEGVANNRVSLTAAPPKIKVVAVQGSSLKFLLVIIVSNS